MRVGNRYVASHGSRGETGLNTGGGEILITLLLKKKTMNPALRIGVAEDEPEVREFYAIVLTELGHKILWAARDGLELVKRFQKSRPDLLIIDIKLPFMDGIDAVRSVTRDKSIPVIVVSGYHDPKTIERAVALQILAYLVKPIRGADLKTAIATAVTRFEELQLLREENEMKDEAWENREVIADATRVVMKSAGIGEQQAYRRLQQLARKENRRLVELSRTIQAATVAPGEN